jgi:hypothetical protein
MLDELLRHRLIEEQPAPNESDFASRTIKYKKRFIRACRARRFHLHAQVGAAWKPCMRTNWKPEERTGAPFEQACHHDRSLSGKAIGYLQQAVNRPSGSLLQEASLPTTSAAWTSCKTNPRQYSKCTRRLVSGSLSLCPQLL